MNILEQLIYCTIYIYVWVCVCVCAYISNNLFYTNKPIHLKQFNLALVRCLNVKKI